MNSLQAIKPKIGDISKFFNNGKKFSLLVKVLFSHKPVNQFYQFLPDFTGKNAHLYPCPIGESRGLPLVAREAVAGLGEAGETGAGIVVDEEAAAGLVRTGRCDGRPW